MKVYRGRFYVGDRLVTEKYFDGDDEEQMRWLEFFKGDARNSSHPLARYEVTTLTVENTEVIVPEHPTTLANLGIDVEG